MSSHTKKRVYTTPEQQQEIIERYKAGEIQADIGKKYGITQIAVSKILQRHEVKGRSHIEASPPTYDVEEAKRLYVEERLSCEEVAKRLGKSTAVIIDKMKELGVSRPKAGPLSTNQLYQLNEDFFSTYNSLSCYWAGFLAADGNVLKNTISFVLSSKDEETLNFFKKHAGLTHPIRKFKKTNSKGETFEYSGLYVTSAKWVKDLNDLFRITPAKAKTLQVPPIPKEYWLDFFRGYFDGDGHATQDGKMQITSGSKIFIEWLVRDVAKAHHSIYPHNDSWGCYISGEVSRSLIINMYQKSTAETRMNRKYLRFQAAGLIPWDLPNPQEN